MGPNPSLREKLRVVSSLLPVCCCTKGEVYEQTVSVSSTYFSVSFFFFPPSFAWCVGFAQLVSGFLSICGCRFVCLWEEVSLGASYVAILNQNTSVLLFNILLETTNDNLAHEKPYGIYQKIAKSNKWA